MTVSCPDDTMRLRSVARADPERREQVRERRGRPACAQDGVPVASAQRWRVAPRRGRAAATVARCAAPAIVGAGCYRAGHGASARSPRAGWAGSAYRDAWDLQKRLAAARADGRIGDQLLLLEHPAVLTLGRGADESHVLAPPAQLEARGIELLRVERGGEVTYHGPGQLVAYPIVRLADRGLLLRPFVRALEAALADTCAAFGVEAGRREGHPGCWVDPEGAAAAQDRRPGHPRRARRRATTASRSTWTSTSRDFDLIDPCGMPGLVSTSIAARARPARRAARPPTASPAPPPSSPGLRRAASARRSTGDLPPGRGPGRGARGRSSASPAPCPPEPRIGDGDEPGPVRAAQGRDHRLVGRDGRRPDVRPRAVRAAGRARSRTAATASTAASRRATASGCGPSRTSRSPSPAPRRRRTRARAAWRRSRSPTRAPPAPGAPSSPRRGSTGRSTPSAATIIEGLLRALPRRDRAPRRAADRTQHLQVVQNWGAQAGARTNHLCFDLYDLPQIPHRIAEELGGAARFLIREGECPYCRLVREEVRRPDHLLYADDHAVAFAPYASPLAVRGVGRARAATTRTSRGPRTRDIAAAAEALRQVLGRLAASLDGPPYNLVLHTAPLQEQVDATYHWHWEIHPRLREIAGLELGTGLPVNPVSPEDAVEELRSGPDGGRAAGASEPMTAAGGGGRHTVRGSRRHRRLGAPRSRSGCPSDRLAPEHPWSPTPSSSNSGEPCPVGLTVSAGWDRDEAYRFVEELFAKHQNEIYAYLLRMLRDPELAADLTQDAFVKAYRAYDSLQKPENARAWLYQIAHRVALDHLRRRPHRPLRPARRRGPQHRAVRRAPRDGGPPLGRAPAGARADPGAPAVRPPPRRAPRPHRPRARRRARRVATSPPARC